MNDQDRLELVDSWLQLNDPVLAKRLHAYENSLDLAGPARPPVVSAAALVGPERDNALAKARQLKAAIEGGGDPIAVFKTDLGDACATILNMARMSAGFNPLATDDPKAAEKFNAYLDKVQKAPFFMLQYSRRRKVENKSKNWDDLINSIGDTFEGLVAEDKQAVVKSLTSLAKVAASKEESRQSEDLFVQSVLRAGTEYDIFLYNSHVVLEAHKEKGSTSKQSVFELTTVKLRLLKSMWPLTAEKVYRAGHAQAVDDWLEDNTTGAGGVKANLCIGANP